MGKRAVWKPLDYSEGNLRKAAWRVAKMSKKVIVRIVGGIGNQLFGYAAARRLALVNDAELVIDDVSGFERDRLYKRKCQLGHFNIPCRRATPGERLEPFSRLRRVFLRAVNRKKDFMHRNYIAQEKVEFDPRLLHVETRGRRLYLEGYWQSERYFKDVEDAIREDLRIAPPQDSANLEMAARIRNCLSVGLHVRFFEGPGRGSGAYNLSSRYYAKASKLIDSLTKDARFFLFSDHPEAAIEHLSLPDSRVTAVSHNRGDENAYADLWLMSLCRHFIIANSTFSWWGAWLSGKRDKFVVAPDFSSRGLCSWGFEGLIPDGWMLV